MIANPQNQQDLDLLISAARDAGAIALRHFQSDPKHWKKGDDTPVSEADLEIDQMLHQCLLGARPDYGWLSEETEDDPARLNAQRCFVVDPIDGTRAFLQGKPHFAVALAVVENGRPQAAALYAPCEDRLFWAQLGAGAFVNQQPIAPRPCTDIEGAHMIGPEGLYRYPGWPTPWPEMDISGVNSIAYSIALVAAGLADGAIALNTKSDWDLAAADLIMHEAGGMLTDHEGNGFRYNQRTTQHHSLVAASTAFHPVLLEKLVEFTQARANRQTETGEP